VVVAQEEKEIPTLLLTLHLLLDRQTPAAEVEGGWIFQVPMVVQALSLFLYQLQTIQERLQAHLL
jgi:hypothetical protein